MKKNIILSIIIGIIALIINPFNNYAEWIRSEKANGWLYIDRTNNELVKNKYFWISDNENDKNASSSLYYFNNYGFMEVSKQLPDGNYVNENGRVLVDGKEMKQESNNTTVINATGKEIVNDTARSNIIKSKKDNEITTSSSTGRLFKNYIIESQNVEILSEKSLNGNKKTNVIWFKENGASVSINTKKYNKVLLKLEREKTSVDITYELRIVINGYEEDMVQFEDDEFELEHEFEWKLNDEVDFVMYQYGEKSYGSKGIYITSGRMAKYKEDDDE